MIKLDDYVKYLATINQSHAPRDEAILVDRIEGQGMRFELFQDTDRPEKIFHMYAGDKVI